MLRGIRTASVDAETGTPSDDGPDCNDIGIMKTKSVTNGHGIRNYHFNVCYHTKVVQFNPYPSPIKRF